MCEKYNSELNETYFLSWLVVRNVIFKVGQFFPQTASLFEYWNQRQWNEKKCCPLWFGALFMLSEFFGQEVNFQNVWPPRLWERDLTLLRGPKDSKSSKLASNRKRCNNLTKMMAAMKIDDATKRTLIAAAWNTLIIFVSTFILMKYITFEVTN